LANSLYISECSSKTEMQIILPKIMIFLSSSHDVLLLKRSAESD